MLNAVKHFSLCHTARQQRVSETIFSPNNDSLCRFVSNTFEQLFSCVTPNMKGGNILHFVPMCDMMSWCAERGKLGRYG